MPYRKSWNKLWRGFRRVCTLPLIVLVKFYQRCISPFTPASCRYTPTCSQYALEALRKYGPLKERGLRSKDSRAVIPGAAADTTPYPNKGRRTFSYPTLHPEIRADRRVRYSGYFPKPAVRR